ncbi:hypothetical protein HAX54_045454, partial [Datura stramonium]|nr:hypothetical protein [Datura stramonium]
LESVLTIIPLLDACKLQILAVGLLLAMGPIKAILACSNSGDVGFDSEDESGNEATSSSVRDSDPMKGDVLKDKRPSGDSLRQALQGAIYLEGLTTTMRPKVDIKQSGSYYLNMVHEFDGKYVEILDGFCKRNKSLMCFHARIDDMEAWVNKRSSDLIMPGLAKFAAELNKSQDEIATLQRRDDTELDSKHLRSHRMMSHL